MLVLFNNVPVENQKGVSTVQQCSIENQKGVSTVQQCSC